MARRAKQPGSGCIAPRESKKHGTVWQIRWRINGGKTYTHVVGPDRREAEQALALKLAEINRGTYRERHEATFHEFASSFFGDHKAHLRPSARERVRIDLEVHLVPFFGDYMLSQIGAELIERYKAEKVAERREGEARVARLEADTGANRRELPIWSQIRSGLRVPRKWRLMKMALQSETRERARQDSNLRLLPPEGSALSSELRAPPASLPRALVPGPHA